MPRRDLTRVNPPTRALFILAHEGAAATVADFMPRWRALGVPVIGLLPLGERLEGFDHCRTTGRSAVLGRPVLERFLFSVGSLEMDNWEAVTIAEYDTLNRHDTLPEVLPGGITSNEVMARPHGCVEGPKELLCFSPWTFDQHGLEEFISAGWAELLRDPDGSERLGILGRWIGLVVERAGIPHATLASGTGWPKFEGAQRWVRQMDINWVHGLKSRDQFGEAWPADDLVQSRAFNGDHFVAAEVAGLVSKHGLQDAVETGTWAGVTTRWLRQHVPGSVTTIDVSHAEIHRQDGEWGVEALQAAGIEPVLGDSAEWIASREFTRPTLFFLDAHGDSNPLIRELDAIAAACRVPPVIVIHDFQTPSPALYWNTIVVDGTEVPLSMPLVHPHLERIYGPGYRHHFNAPDHAAGARRGVVFIEPPVRQTREPQE